MKIGNTGEHVKLLQEALGVNVDGRFGKNTEIAVKHWQATVGLVPDGIVGGISQALLFEVKGIHIVNKLHWAHFFAQISHESAGFKHIEENLRYSEAGLLRVFPKYFNNKNVTAYAGRPQKIANRVYANRMGNGDELSGDGWKYRGRGYIQLTGKRNYEQFSDYINNNCVCSPQLVSERYPLISAEYFFTKNNIWPLCSDTTVDSIKRVTKRVNGGYNGLEDRIERFNNIYNAL